MYVGRRIFTAIVLIILLVNGCGDKEDKEALLSQRAPDFALPDLNGRTFRLENLKGKVIVLNFFATWCAPCRKEIPDLIRLHKKYKDKGLEIVGIGLDMEGPAVLGPFKKQFSISYPVVMGTREMVLDYGGIQGIPTTFLIDRNGIIANRFIGFQPPKVLEESVRELLTVKG